MREHRADGLFESQALYCVRLTGAGAERTPDEFNTTGTALNVAPGGSVAGVRTLICVAPAISPGAEPAYKTVPSAPANVTRGGSSTTMYGGGMGVNCPSPIGFSRYPVPVA